MDDFVQYMHDNGWPIWAIAVVLFFLATGRSIVNAGSVLFNRKRREQDAENVSTALTIAREAHAKADMAAQGLVECQASHQKCEGELMLVRIESEANRARIDELTARIDGMTGERVA